ncbi:MAG: homocysteine S-methyltransferase family protein [Bacteroidales bacterium]
MKKITEKLKSGKILISDGAWGTFLHKKGLQPGECPELWNITHEKEVFEIAQSYINAGADMIETNSFGGNAFKLKHYGLENKVHELNRSAAEISRKAAGTDKLVLGSMGPTGVILMMGEVSPDELYEAFKDQAIALEAGGADAVIVETMTDLEEARIAIKAAKENTKCEIICTMTFEKTVQGEYRSMMGYAPADVVDELINAGADIIGANCGNGMEGMIQITREIREKNKEIPVLIHANAGLPEYRDGNTFFPETPEQMANLAPKLVQAGASVIGGCCGTTPEHISKIADSIKSI